MYFLAPLVVALVFSGALYKTKEVWPKAAYNLLTEKVSNKAERLLQYGKALKKQVADGKITQLEANNRYIAAEKQVATDNL